MIWKKYLLKQLFFTFCFFFASLFFLFIVVDLSTRIKSLHEEFEWKGYFLYYLCQLIRHGDILISLPALLSLTKVALQFNQNRELTALLASGISKKKITQPFLIFVLSCFFLILFNYQVLQPSFYFQMAEHTEFKKWNSSLTPVWMKDQSLFLFQHFQPQKKIVTNCIWLKDADTILHLDTLHLTPPALATGVKLFSKKESKNFSFQEKSSFLFPDHLLPKDINSAFCPVQWQPITHLFFRENEQATSFACYKLSFPLLFLFLYLAALFFGLRLRFSFWIHGFALFGLLFAFTLLKTLLILSENQIFSPYLVFGFVTLIPFTYCVVKYAKL